MYTCNSEAEVGGWQIRGCTRDTVSNKKAELNVCEAFRTVHEDANCVRNNNYIF